MAQRCHYVNCPNTNEKYSLYRFPVWDKNRLRIWINNSGNIKLTTLTPDELKNRRLCEVHFDPCYKSQNANRNRLVGTAIPRHYHCEDESINVISSVSVCEQPLEGTQVEVTPETSPEKLKVLTPKKVYGKRVFHILEAQEIGSSSASSQFENEMNMPSPKKFKHGNSCVKEECVKKNKLLHAAQIELKNKTAQIKRLKTKLMREKSLENYKFSSLTSKLMATMQMRKNNRKWTKEEKRLSLAIFYKSPATYNFLRDQGVVLPAVSSIKRWLSESDCLPGIAKETFNQIKLKFENATHLVKACILTFDEMSIMACLEYNKKFDFIEGYEDLGRGERSQKLAKHVLVFLARGIYSNWKLPLCYFLSNGNVKTQMLQTLIKVVVNKLFDAGLLPKATVCDQVSTNQSALKGLGVSKDNPFFYVNDRKLFAIFDVPHCIKNLRNNWLFNNYSYDNKEVSFKDVIAAYDIDKKNKSRTLLKITPSHLSPNTFQKMKVKLATQIFSHSVGAAVNTAIKTKELMSPTAANTAEFIIIINDLFDSLNSKTKFHKNPKKCGLTKNNEARLALEKGLNVIKVLKKITLKGNRKKLTTPPCFEGLQQSCNAILQFYDEENTGGIEYLLTNRLNQDILENLFSIYRLKGGNNKNPSARLLRSVFRSYLVEMLVRLPGHQNCEEQVDTTTCELPKQVTSLAKDPEPEGLNYDAEAQITQSIDPAQEEAPTTSTSRADTGVTYPAVRSVSSKDGEAATLEQCSVSYFAGWLAKKCNEKFQCQKCYSLMTKNVDLSDKRQLFILEKTYGHSDNIKLKCPSDSFYQIIDVSLTNYEKHFDLIKHKLEVKKNMLIHLKCILNIDYAYTCNSYCTEHLNYSLEKLIISKINYYCKSQKRNMIQSQQKIRLLQNK